MALAVTFAGKWTPLMDGFLKMNVLIACWGFYKISNVRKSNINKCWILIHYEGIWRALRQLENSRWYGTFLSTMLLSVLDFYTLIDCKSSHTISEHLFTGDHLLALCIFLSDKKISNKSKGEKIGAQDQYRKILV